MIQKLNRILKIAIAIGLIILAAESIYFKYDNCAVCKFNYENKNLNAIEFMKIYSDKCLKSNDFIFNQNLSGFSQGSKPTK